MIEFRKIEEEILNFWEKNKIYERLKERNKNGEPFYFLQGPPYTSGKLHIGQAWNNTLKDMALRYKRMKGLDVWDRGGFDMHGLPTENAVQKKLKLKTKEDISKYGVEKFVKECFNFSIEHAGFMNDDLRKLGVWLDHKNAYFPIKKEYINGEWAFFKKAWEQNRLYKGKRVVHWDAQSETSLAKHELEYKNVKDQSIFLKFKKKNTKNEYFIIWTTTPWTIPYNLAIMANPNIDYVKIKVDDEFWILAKALAGIFMASVVGKKYTVVEEFKGEKLDGMEYEHFLNKDMGEVYKELKKEWSRVHTIILSKEYVDTSSGSGLVHCAPGCGPEDQEVGERYGLGSFNNLDERGQLEDEGKFKGWTAKVDDAKFIKEFEKQGVLLATTEVEHEYPHSWRSHQPVVFRTTEQWFVKIKDIISKLIDFNKKVRWVPKFSGESYERWTSNLRDINITRQRFWGCPVPIWVNTKDSSDFLVIGSVEELEKLSGEKNIEPHKPWVDKIKFKIKEKEYERIPDVADVWIDSGTASWNSLYNDSELMKRYFPADLILEATEQTRLWFSVLQIYSAIYTGKSAYKNVYAHGMIYDFQGTKMSKSLGNIISPYEVIDKYSSDILRNYLCSVTAGEAINFNWEEVKVKQRNLIVFSNIANFIIDLEKQKPKKGKPGVEEKWIMSKYHSTLKKVTELFEEYRLDETLKEIESLFMLLSREYIKFVRDKAPENSSVLETVKEIYSGILKMFAPAIPFLTEHIWQTFRKENLVEEESVHLCDWPKFDKKKIDENLEGLFESATKVIEKGLAERDKQKVGLRWPLSKAIATVTSNVDPTNHLSELIARQLNVKEVFIKLGNDFEVELDTKMTKELEAEGYARELARKIQAERKNQGLQKTDIINLKINSTKNLNELLQSQTSFLRERTNSEKIELVLGVSSSESNLSSIKDEKVSFQFTKL